MRLLYRITLGMPDPHFYLPGAKTPSTLPEVRNHNEQARLFTVTTNPKHRSVLMTPYVAGLRASEIGRVRVSDIDSKRMSLRVDQRKGNKDRYLPLSPRLLEQLREYWRRKCPEPWLFPNELLARPLGRHGAGHIYRRSQGEDATQIKRAESGKGTQPAMLEHTSTPEPSSNRMQVDSTWGDMERSGDGQPSVERERR